MSLHEHGWSEFFSGAFTSLNPSGLEPGRVVFSGGGLCRLATAAGDRSVSLAGRLRHGAASAAELPVVGDWVAYLPDRTGGGRVERILPRRSRLSRKVPGSRTEEQVVAANVDLVFAVMGLDGDYSPRRVERILTLAWESGARPEVLLNKTDLCPDPDVRQAEMEGIAPGVPVLLLSSLEGSGVGEVSDRIAPGETAVLVGSSGVGKSTLINRLLGREAQAVRPVREHDSRGRHATSHRELFRLPGGGLLIDSPGIREVQLWAGEESLGRAFDDVERLAASCRYRDCRHAGEPGCAVMEAVAGGRLEEGRLESWRALQREILYLRSRVDDAARRERRRKWRAIHKEMRRWYRPRRR